MAKIILFWPELKNLHFITYPGIKHEGIFSKGGILGRAIWYLVGFCNFLYWYLLNWLIYLIFTDLFYILKNKLKNKETLQPYDDGVSEESEEEETEELRGGPCDQWLLVNI